MITMYVSRLPTTDSPRQAQCLWSGPECGKAMCWVRRSGLADSQSDFQIVLIDYPAEAVPPDRIVASKLSLVHKPAFAPPILGLSLRMSLTYCRELLSGCFSECRVFVVPIVCLLVYTKQLAKEQGAIASSLLCVQVLYCLVLAFFRIGILNFASATLIISS